jgi:ABC-2 type transport system permease protein
MTEHALTVEEASAAAEAVSPVPVVWSLAERELVRFFRQRNRVVGALLQPIMFWALFSAGLRGNALGFEFFFPGTIAMILLFTAIFATVSIIEDRSEGFLQSVLVAPAPRWAMVMGKIIGGSAIALIQALIFLALGIATLKMPGSLVEVGLSIVLMAVTAVALTALGFFLAWRMESSQGYHAIMSVFLFPMWLLSGSLFPDDPLSWITWISRFNPLTYAVAGLRQYLHFGENAGAGTLPSLTVCWLVSIAFAVVMVALSWRIAGTRTTGDLK